MPPISRRLDPAIVSCGPCVAMTAPKEPVEPFAPPSDPIRRVVLLSMRNRMSSCMEWSSAWKVASSKVVGVVVAVVPVEGVELVTEGKIIAVFAITASTGIAFCGRSVVVSFARISNFGCRSRLRGHGCRRSRRTSTSLEAIGKLGAIGRVSLSKGVLGV
eukprot:scaffold3672_cov86-Cylindrotheca_fusiformis.AAC.5